MLDAADLRREPKLHPQCPGVRDQEGDQVGIETLQRTDASMQDGDLGPSPDGHMGEFEGNVPPSDKEETSGSMSSSRCVT